MNSLNPEWDHAPDKFISHKQIDLATVPAKTIRAIKLNGMVRLVHEINRVKPATFRMKITLPDQVN